MALRYWAEKRAIERVRRPSGCEIVKCFGDKLGVATRAIISAVAI